MLLQEIGVGMATILHALITVMDALGDGLRSASAHSKARSVNLRFVRGIHGSSFSSP